MDIALDLGILCGCPFVVTFSCDLISPKNYLKGRVEKAVIQRAAHCPNATMITILPRIGLEKKKKKKQKGQYYTTWLSEAIFLFKEFFVLFGGAVCVFVDFCCCCCYCFWCFIAVYLLILPCWWLDIRYGRELWFRLWSNHCWRSRLTTETPTLFLKSSENCQGVLCEFPSKNSAVIIRIHLQWAGCSYWEKFVCLLWGRQAPNRAQDRPCVGMLLQRNNGF